MVIFNMNNINNINNIKNNIKNIYIYTYNYYLSDKSLK